MASNLRVWQQERDRQPLDATEVHWANPITKGLRVAFTNGINAVNGEIATVFGSVPVGVTSIGMGSGPVLSGSDYLRIRSNLSSPVASSLTDKVTVLTYSVGGTTSRWAWGKSNGSGTGLSVLQATQGAYEDGTYLGSNRFSSGPIATGLFNDYVNCTAIRGNSADVGFFVNGRKNVDAYHVGAYGDWDESAPYIEINRAASGSVYNSAARIVLIALWERNLSDAELASVTSAPWQLFEPRRIIVPVTVAGAGNTIAVPAGSLTLTGFAPTVTATANQVVAVPAGTLTLAPQTPTVTSSDHQTISVPAGTLTLTANAPTVTASENQSISVPAGALTLTGFEPTVTATAHQVVAVPAGTLTLTGYAPTVAVSDASAVQIPAGALTLTGFAPTVAVSANNTISVPLGTLTLTGNAPTVVATNPQLISVPAGTLTLTGYAPTVSSTGVNNLIAVPRGTLTLSGHAPVVRVSADADVFIDRFAARSRITQSLRFGSRITTQVGLRSSLKD